MKDNQEAYKNKKPLKICVSGFETTEKEEIKKTIKFFKGEPTDGLTRNTHILIAKKANTEKVIIAKKSNIPIVNKSFIISLSSGYINALNENEKEKIDFSKFSLRPLEGISFKIATRKEKNQRETNKIQHLEGKIKDLGGYINETTYDYIIIPNEIEFDMNFSSLNMSVCVSENWLNDIKTEFIDPIILNEYSYLNFYIKERIKNIKIEYSDLNSNQLPSLFQSDIFYIDSDLNSNYKDLLRLIISTCKGIYVDIPNPFITYIVTNNKNLNYKSCFNVIKKVNPFFLYDCLIKKSLQDYKEYYPKGEEIENKEKGNINKDNNKDKENNNESQIRYSSIIRRSLFKDYNFMIWKKSYSSSNYNLTLLEKTIEKIQNQSGTLINEVENIKLVHYLIVNDGFKLEELIEMKNKNSFLIVSHRFVNFCEENKKIVNFKKEKYLHLYPLPYKVPFFSFENVRLNFKGFEVSEIEILGLLMKLLGAKVENDYNKMTHIVVYEENEAKAKECISKLKEYNLLEKIKLVNSKWVYDSLLSGKKIDEEKYLIKLY